MHLVILIHRRNQTEVKNIASRVSYEMQIRKKKVENP